MAIITTSTTAITTGYSPTGMVADDTWHQWIYTETTATATGSYIWETWTSTTTGWDSNCFTLADLDRAKQLLQPCPPKITKDQFLRKRNQIIRHNNRIKERQEKRAAAVRAKLLLEQTLSPVQLAQLKRFGYFFVQGNETGKTYRIRFGRSGNVDVMDNGKVNHRLCAHPDIYCPNGDTMLVQKIMLETMEHAFLQKAIRH